MPVKEKEIYTLGIAILGNFNPSIITPHWLANKGLIRNSEADSAKVDIIHPEISRFELRDWLTVEISQSRADFKTKRESEFMAMRDLICGLFSLLKETPIEAMGINHLVHFTLKDFKEYENFGYWFSPVKTFGDVLHEPKLQNIQYVESKKENNEDGTFRFIISPSDLILDSKSVLFNINHHFINDGKTTKEFLDLLNSKWDYSFKKVDTLNKAVWNKVVL